MLENEPLTFSRISKKLRLPAKRTKEQEPVKDASTLKKTSSDILKNDAQSFDGPSFDLGLTPTPPDVNLDAETQDVSIQGMSNVIQSLTILLHQTLAMTDQISAEAVETMLENEKLKLLAEKSNALKPTNTTSPIAVLPVSFAMPNDKSVITPAIEKKRKDVEKENIPQKPNDKEPMRSKRLLKLTENMKSPFKDRFIKLGVKCSPDEELLFDCIFSATEEHW